MAMSHEHGTTLQAVQQLMKKNQVNKQQISIYAPLKLLKNVIYNLIRYEKINAALVVVEFYNAMFTFVPLR